MSRLGQTEPILDGQPEKNEQPCTESTDTSTYRPNAYLAAVLFGYDAGAIGPITQMPHFFPFHPFKRGLLVAALILTSTFSNLPAGPLSDRFSRRSIVLTGALTFTIGMIICTASTSYGMFLASRCIAGLGQGLFLSTTTVWQIEIAPKTNRGKVSTMNPLLMSIAIILGYFICYGTVELKNRWQWRVPCLVEAAVAGIFSLLLMTPIVPESPRWLLLHTDRTEEARHTIEAFAHNPEEARIEWDELVARTQLERNAVIEKVNEKQGWQYQLGISGVRECFERKEKLRGKTIMNLVLNLMMALSGIDAIVWYAPLIYVDAGLSTNKASFLASGIMGIIILFVMAFSQFYLMEHVKRRTNVLIGTGVMVISLLMLGALSSDALSARPGVKWASVVLVNIYVIGNQGFYICPVLVYAPEIQPNRTRATSCALARALLSITVATEALVTPRWLEASRMSVFLTFAGFNLFSFLLALVFMPETLGSSMQEIDDIWEKDVERFSRRFKRIFPRGTST